MNNNSEAAKTLRGNLAHYPEEFKKLPFCCWKWKEDNNQRKTKVPYNPRTGLKARPNDITTFSDIDAALAACESGGYAGVGIKTYGNVGAIDLDHCIGSEGVLNEGADGVMENDGDTLSENARKVLAILPDAFVEKSPSGTGLHLYFIIPDGFTFDRDTYYINNRKMGMEFYAPEATNRFLTVTGEIYRDGDMEVSEAQLQEFLDTFMKKPEWQYVPVTPPEGGSILSDGEVIRKASAGKDGDRFMAMFRGDWENAQPDESEDWSHSEADLSVCRKLAFYCRGDADQVDRIFRTSGLMRDKWNRRIGRSTYGYLTINHAIAGCDAFYDPEHGRVDAAEEFSEIDEPAADIHNDSNSSDYPSHIDKLLAGGLTTDTALSDEMLAASAWAYANDPARYTRIKSALPGKVSTRDFERAVKQVLKDRPELKKEEPDSEERVSHLLLLKDISTPGMIIPPNWIVDDKGIRHIDGAGTVTNISPAPLFISAILENVDDGTEKVEVTFRHHNRYKTIIAPHSDMVNKNAIIRYKDFGLPVSSGTAANLTKYIAEFEGANARAIPLKRCVGRGGWIGNSTNRCAEFFPYYLKSAVEGQEPEENSEGILKALTTSGSEEKWLSTAMKVRTMPFARAMLAASFASPLLYPLQHRNILYHSWYSSRSGKTAALKFAMSIWGNPERIMMSFFTTIVGLEHRAGLMCHLPLGIDEFQSKDKYLNMDNVVYSLGNGEGKTRGRAGGGIRHTDKWHNCVISTGEQPISTDKSMDGVNTRLLEVYGCPVDDEALAVEMHQTSELHYGFAGERFIRWVVENVISAAGDGEEDLLHKDFNDMSTTLTLVYGDQEISSTQIDNIAVLALADFYASQSVFGIEREQAWSEALDLGQTLIGKEKQEDHTDTVDRAWQFVCGWAAENKSHFQTSTNESFDCWGRSEDGRTYVISNILNQALEEAGYSYRKCIRGFGERGYVNVKEDSQGKNRTQILKRINGIPTRVYDLKFVLKDDYEDMPVLGNAGAYIVPD